MLRRPVLYENTYVWLVFLSAMDIMMTWVVLYFGGREANALADAVLRRWGLPGMALFKFAFIIVAILVAELVGRRDYAAGRTFARFAVLITCLPVLVAFALLMIHLLT